LLQITLLLKKKIILAFFFISSILSSQDIDFNNIKIDDVKNIINNVLNKNKPEKKIKENSSHFLSESDKYMINKMINKFTTKEISEIISKNTKISKKEVYNYCLKIKNEK